MKILKSNWIIKSLSVIMVVLLSVISCKEDNYLDVPRQDVLSTTNYPFKVDHLDLLLSDIYGRLRNSVFSAGNFMRFGTLMSHEADQAYTQPDGFDGFAKNSHSASNGDIANLWNSHYENVAKVNSFLAGIEQVKTNNKTLSPADFKVISEMEGQALFLRAWNYFYLEAFFGSTFITDGASAAALGIPIVTKIATSVPDTFIPRATVSEVWDFIISDLIKAETLLEGKTWDIKNRGRVTPWAVKALLGKCYLFTKRDGEATDKLKEVIDNSGKSLLSFGNYVASYNGEDAFEFNSESLFEINHNTSGAGEWNSSQQTSTFMGVFMGQFFLREDRTGGKDGFGNIFMHDKNLIRFGYTDTYVVNEADLRVGGNGVWKDDVTIKTILAPYLAYAAQIRADESVDPRLFIAAVQPYADSLYKDWEMRPVIKNQGEGADLRGNHAWSMSKNIPKSHNQYLIRLADVYLMYAEALISSGGSQSEALEYINKVKRRAYNKPANTPDPTIDYASLTAPTKASDVVLANNPLRYERFAELFLEGHWWFDVARWKVGAQESAHYMKVGSGPLVWADRAYALPIPEPEMNTNKALEGKQNSGY